MAALWLIILCGARSIVYAVWAVQSVMAIDTMLNGLVNQGAVNPAAATRLRGQINQAYAAVREPNGYQPAAFRRALGGAFDLLRIGTRLRAQQVPLVKVELVQRLPL